MRKRIRTMEEFAEAIGLSRPTVSKYFQDPGSVRAKVREKIEAGLSETGFRPNLFAVNLNRRRAKIIGLVFPSSLDPFYMDLRRRIEMEASRAGYLSFAFSSEGRTELEAEAIEMLTSLNVAGIIMAPVGTRDHPGKLKALARNVPIIFIDAPFDGEEPFVGTNNAQSVALITDYLTRLGDSPCYFDMPAVNANAAARRNAYIATMERRGLEPVIVPTEPSTTWDFERFAHEQAGRVLREGGFPTRSVLCGNDRVAFGVLAAVHQAGLKVGIEPGCDLRVAGHDNHSLSEYIWPPLTTVSQNTAEMGRIAIRLLLSKLDPAKPADAPRTDGDQVLVNAELVLRASA
ncbi:LacI family DNA-binding transcriptional regulator [Chelativorans sp. AA-79]|uniref:LacI family DNA-binding transcriptional regulator n=1 Tax=Chelativorans sp. AA-79 TaxID=3028735 RepID=UPI0023FA09F7|nr:LacI family DNA-binding transcriptional regulator [Chelativorans sp. AA-79]WEX10608.1 LacI family DNA-binding transcriptional regulator [Chelativorans sp. AA-79]